MTGRYEELHTRSISDPEGFWGDAASEIDWIKPWDTVLDSSNPPFYRWFKGGVLNTAYNAVDRHVEAGRGDQAAIIYDSPVTSTVQTITYAELLDLTARFAGALRDLGVTKGDRVILYMPMIPQAIVAMLACARLGAVHSVVFGGFAPHELSTRINDSKPKAIVTASCGIEGSKVIKYKPLLDAAIEHSDHKPDHVVVFQRPQAVADLGRAARRGLGNRRQRRGAGRHRSGGSDRPALYPLHLRHDRSAQGRGPRQRRPCGGAEVDHEQHVRHQAGRGLLGRFRRGLGRRSLLHLLRSAAARRHHHRVRGQAGRHPRCRHILAGDPAAQGFGAVHGADGALRAIKREDPDGKLIPSYDLSSLRTLFLAGERSDPDTLHWAEDHLKVPVVDHWWQTETGWCIAGNPLGIEKFKIKYGSATKPLPGWDVRALDISNNEVKRGDIGAISVKLPLPPGTLTTLWNADARFVKSYMTDYPGYYQTGDAGFIDDDGYVYIMARTDDIINVAGHRLSTGAMEEVLSSHKDVAECAVIGVADQLKGQVPLGFLVLKNGVTRDHAEITKEVVQLVRDEIGPVAAFKLAIVVDRLPKTRSGKILRGTMQKIADSETYKLPATIDDPLILSEISDALQGIGYAKAGMA